jgi:polysaccharide export outer membrane protein
MPGQGGGMKFLKRSSFSLMVLFILPTFISCSSNSSPTASLHQAENIRVTSAPYLVGKGDLLEIVTWKEPDFSREVQVRIDGKISFPLIEDLPAAGRTTESLEEYLREKLSEYVTHPVVSVSVKEARSQRYYIVGEVQNPGEYPLQKQVSVMQAFALAGGFTEWARKNAIVLIRRDGGREKSIPINFDEIVKKGDLEQNVLLKAEDVLVVP